MQDRRPVRPAEPDHFPDLVRFERAAEGQGSFDRRGIFLQEGTVDRQQALACLYGKTEGESVVFLVFYGYDLRQGEGRLVGLSGLEAPLVRNEFDHLVGDPAHAAGQGGGEGEQAVIGPDRGRPGQLDPDGAVLRDDTAAVGGDIVGKNGIGKGGLPVGAGCQEQEGNGGCQGPPDG